MDFQAIIDHLRAVNAPGVIRAEEPRPANKKEKDPGRVGDSYILIEAASITEFLRVCKTDGKLAFELLIDISANDPAVDSEDLWIVGNLFSIEHRHRLAFKAILPKSAPSLPTSVPIYRAAQWHERECAEMYGITFEGHPDPRNILLPDDWVGYPLRKDYVFPTEYHGVSCE
ncbi:MAG: NADH-quinone oxidoreductase subunit C [Planctomycetota bacterium]|jgi:NADH-quinone oxidoreductase subunit C